MRKGMKNGFSLLELSIVLAIIGVVMGSSMMVGKHQIARQEVAGTYGKLQRIDERLKLYAKKYGKLPCPAPINATKTDATYGRKATDCSDATPPTGITRAEYPASSGYYVRIGGVPFKDLNLSDAYANDEWGNRIAYTVTENAITAVSDTMEGYMQVNDSSGNSISDLVVYTLVSSGASGKGGTSDATLSVNTACDAAAKDGENCDADGVFVDDRIYEGETAASFYDDLMIWRPRMNILEQEPVADIGVGPDTPPPPACDKTGVKYTWDITGSGTTLVKNDVEHGDINADGFSDIVMGSPRSLVGAMVDAGKVYITYGKSTSWTSPGDLDAPAAGEGTVLSGLAADNGTGSGVSLGDINGDGYDDVVFGAPYADPGGRTDAGAAYVVFGKAGGLGASVNLATLNGTNGFVINGVNAGDMLGYDVSAAGDFNGDGYDDIVVGAPIFSSNTGTSYVIFGKAAGWAASLDPTTLNGTNGLRITAAAAGQASGLSVAIVGDVNADGYDDIGIGAPNASAVYVIFGAASGWAATFNPATLNGSNGFLLGADIVEAGGMGMDMAAVGDINNDGIDDFATVAVSMTTTRALVVFGKSTAWAASMGASTLTGTAGFRVSNSDTNRIMSAVSAMGDINNDGIGDFGVGSARQTSGEGESYVIFGKSSGWAAIMDVQTLNGSTGLILQTGGVAGAKHAFSVAAAGDVDDDGKDDFFAAGQYISGTYLPHAYLVFGQTTALTSPYDLETVAGNSCTSSGTGWNPCTGGDVNAVYHDRCYAYHYLTLYGDYSAAAAVCAAWGGKPVSIESAGENSAVQALILSVVAAAGYHTWIGAYDTAGDGSHEWVSGKLARYDGWAAGEPNVDGDLCASISGVAADWRDEDCAASDKYIVCERSRSD